MMNNDRVVNVQETDLLSVYFRNLKIANVSVTKLAAAAPATFVQATNSATIFADEPVKTFDFAATATAGTVYFVPALDYAGFTLAGVATETAGDDVVAGNGNLYKAVLSSGTVTITSYNP
jgi:hypothetical protein